MIQASKFFPLVFAFIILVPFILISFDVIPFNHFALFTFGFAQRKSLDPTDDSENKTRPLYIPVSVENTYDNLHEQATLDLIKKDLQGKGGICALKHKISHKMYIGSTTNL